MEKKLTGSDDEVLNLVFDMDLGRPACALLQGVMGGSQGVTSRLPAETWLTSPTPGMKLYRITRAELRKLGTFLGNGAVDAGT